MKLSEVFYGSNFPDWINSENVIYYIYNTKTGKYYVGQAKWFYGRLVANGSFSHKWSYENKVNRHLYNSMHKYGLDQFEIGLLEENCIDLNEREIYWIQELNAFEGGYNHNKGGHDSSHLYTPEVNERRCKSMMNTMMQEMGCLAIHTKSAIKNSLETRRMLGDGDPMYMCRSPLALEKLLRSRRDPSVISNRIESDKSHHGGVMGWNTKESIEKSIRTRSLNGNGDPCYGFHKPGIQDKSASTKLLMTIEKCINHLLHNNIKLTKENYIKYSPLGSSHAHRHVRLVLKRLDQLIADDRWTQDMSSIFTT